MYLANKIPQYQWWLSGIFRDVNLVAFPKVHIQDFRVQTLLDDHYLNATLSVDVELSRAAEVSLQLFDGADRMVVRQSKLANENQINFTIPIENPHKWTAETPYLYHLVLSTKGCSVAHRIGFRRLELKDGLLLVNGKRIVFRGVNRHEHHPRFGRAVPFEFLKQDIILMKSHNINAIRTSHQPNDTKLYDLADEVGLWIIDEADLDCHGFVEAEEAALSPEQKRLGFEDKKALVYQKAARWTSDNPDWEDAYIDRARQLVMRDKNHPCVILWSLGNESFYGSNHQSMYDWIKSYDSTRLVHYGGDSNSQTVS
jgi:beta-galactosidase